MYKGEEETPFYQQLKDKIIDDIESGKLKHGDKLPSERELAEQYGISRMTARHTLSILEREGVVERRVGAGTFISNYKIEMDFITFNSFTRTMLGKGLTPSTQVLSIKKSPAKPSIANKLHIPVGEELVIIKRLRNVNGIPVSIEESFIPYKYCPDIDHLITNNHSLYQMLESEYGITLVKAKEYMKVKLAEESDSKLLRIRSESPCVLREAVAYDDQGQSIEFSTSLTRSDIVRFYSELHLK
ncbi:GntR family transcriptional regulator [Robertmurraya korlensis]|uniref:GntR family transcriptional regulator n=1 Tax=Robertmurraya korlensis TaxID=519977 RepID=UPI00203AE1B3|nr:GntR family transcriptional regulator [Robertmurraya korlensis]MCM3600050.1 GntR family transcriptional regulator [Robertmurraya korlensis]